MNIIKNQLLIALFHIYGESVNKIFGEFDDF